MPATPLGGPSTQTEQVSRGTSGAILSHITGNNFELYSYSLYEPATKKWTAPFVAADGSYGTESTMQSGKKIAWTGILVDKAGRTTQVRDTDVYAGSSFTDLGESLLGGTWKTEYKITCTKS